MSSFWGGRYLVGRGLSVLWAIWGGFTRKWLFYAFSTRKGRKHYYFSVFKCSLQSGRLAQILHIRRTKAWNLQVFESPRKNAGVPITSEIICCLWFARYCIKRKSFHLSYLYTKGKGFESHGEALIMKFYGPCSLFYGCSGIFFLFTE